MAKMLLRFRSLYDFQKAFPTELSCIRFLENKRWPNGVVSPYDPTSQIYKYKQVGRYTCKNSGKDFNVRTGTIFQDTKIPLRKWFLVIFLVITCPKGISAYKIQKDIAVSYKTAWFLLHRIREALAYNGGKLTGEVELDETFVGGHDKNRHAKMKVHKQGRSCTDKKAVLGMLQRKNKDREKTVICKVIEDTGKKSLTPPVVEHVELSARLYADDWHGYNDVFKLFPNHAIVSHSKKIFGVGEIHTNTIEGFWGNYCKRCFYGCYNHVIGAHMQRYFDEFSFRYNHSNKSERERFSKFFDNIEHRLTYKMLINEYKERNLLPIAVSAKEGRKKWIEKRKKQRISRINHDLKIAENSEKQTIKRLQELFNNKGIDINVSEIYAESKNINTFAGE